MMSMGRVIANKDKRAGATFEGFTSIEGSSVRVISNYTTPTAAKPLSDTSIEGGVIRLRNKDETTGVDLFPGKMSVETSLNIATIDPNEIVLKPKGTGTDSYTTTISTRGIKNIGNESIVDVGGSNIISITDKINPNTKTTIGSKGMTVASAGKKILDVNSIDGVVSTKFCLDPLSNGVKTVIDKASVDRWNAYTVPPDANKLIKRLPKYDMGKFEIMKHYSKDYSEKQNTWKVRSDHTQGKLGVNTAPEGDLKRRIVVNAAGGTGTDFINGFTFINFDERKYANEALGVGAKYLAYTHEIEFDVLNLEGNDDYGSDGWANQKAMGFHEQYFTLKTSYANIKTANNASFTDMSVPHFEVSCLIPKFSYRYNNADIEDDLRKSIWDDCIEAQCEYVRSIEADNEHIYRLKFRVNPNKLPRQKLDEYRTRRYDTMVVKVPTSVNTSGKIDMTQTTTRNAYPDTANGLLGTFSICNIQFIFKYIGMINPGYQYNAQQIRNSYDTFFDGI